MINKTKMRIPKKYHIAINEIMHDSTGYWIWLNDGYKSSDTMTHTIHEDNQRNALKALQTIIKVEEEETADTKADTNFKYIWSDSLEQLVVSEFYYNGKQYKWNDIDVVYYWIQSDDTFLMEVPLNATANKR